MTEIDELKNQLSVIYSRLAEIEFDEVKKIAVRKEVFKQYVINEVCFTYHLSLHKIRSKDRHSEVVMARHLICWLLKNGHVYYTLGEIAKAINRDHASVIHACKSIENYIYTYEDKKEEFLGMRERIQKTFSNDY